MRAALLFFPDYSALALAPSFHNHQTVLSRGAPNSRLDLICYSSMNTRGASSEPSITKSNCYRIEKVNTKRRALDVKVFRDFTLPIKEFILEHNRNLLNDATRTGSGVQSDLALSEDDALNLLMPGYDESGTYTKLRAYQTDYEAEVYFAAIYCPEICNEPGKEETNTNINSQLFERANGVVGVIGAQIRHRSSLKASSSINSIEHHTTIPAVKMPYPHLYLANMRVHDLLRRRGIGQGLLSFAVEYAKTLSSKNENNIPLVLTVDNDNTGAVSMYEKFGFEYIERKGNFCMMVFWT